MASPGPDMLIGATSKRQMGRAPSAGAEDAAAAPRMARADGRRERAEGKVRSWRHDRLAAVYLSGNPAAIRP
jgi:hypothetical protein